MMVHLGAVLVFVVVLPTLLVAHQVADHWVQTQQQAIGKGAPGWSGRWACARHVAAYTLTTAVAVGVVVWLFALPVSLIGFVAGQAVSAVTHYWADRRVTLAALARRLGRSAFYALGSARPGQQDSVTLGGAYLLDQAWHWGWLWVAAIVTAVA